MTERASMPNTTMNVSLPERLKDYVQERVEEGAYSTPSDYVRALIRDDMKRRAEDRLEELLLEGLDSGDPQPLDAAEWVSIREEAHKRAAAKRREA
jgi:antitoxin ParD1/3/4